MLRPLKSEIEAIASMLRDGADSPESLAADVIKRVEELRGERTQHYLVFELSPGVYQGYGGYATRDAAFSDVDKYPMAWVAKRAAIVPVLGVGQAKRDWAAAEEPPNTRIDIEVQKDQTAFRNGWKGNMRDRAKFLPAGS